MNHPGEMSRTEIINFLINLWGYKSYLEIGVQYSSWNYDLIQCEHKEGVDPGYQVTHQMTSDEFFEDLSLERKYDLIFVDGLHEEGQVHKDILNSLDHLNDGGRIVAHDLSPTDITWEHTSHNGTCWRAWARLRMTRPELTMYVVDTDYGCGVIRKGGQILFPLSDHFEYLLLEEHRGQLLGLVTPYQFRRMENVLRQQSPLSY